MNKLLLTSIFLLIIFASFAPPGDLFSIQSNQQQNETKQKELLIYPNPTETGQVTLEMNSGEISEIRLINITGKEVVLHRLDFGLSKYVLSLDNLPNGIYFVRIQSTDNKTLVQKLVVSSH